MEWLKRLFKREIPPQTASPTHLLPDDWQMPASGKIIPLSEVADPAFAQGMMGQGFAIRADAPTVCSPVSGKIEAVFPGGHAIGITADNGTEILLHIGIDSVKLKGEGFQPHCPEGTAVQAGTPLVDVDFPLLQNRLPDAAVLIVFPNINDGEIIIHDNRPIWQAKGNEA